MYTQKEYHMAEKKSNKKPRNSIDFNGSEVPS